MNYSMLFSPIKIGAMEIRNRLVVPAMENKYANPDGSMTQQSIDYWVARAKGGWGLLTEVARPVLVGKAISWVPSIREDDELIANWKKLVDEVHKYGAKIALQLHHAGRREGSDKIGTQR